MVVTYNMIWSEEIPVKPYVQKFIYREFGEPAFIPASNHIGKFLYLLLEDNRRQKDKRIELDYNITIKIEIPLDEFHREYPTKLKFIIPEDTFERKGYMLTATSVTHFNNFIEDSIKREMYAFLDALTQIQDMRITEAIELYQEKMGFSENEFTYDAISRSYRRYRKRKLFGLQ
jgi:hypothetical protein